MDRRHKKPSAIQCLILRSVKKPDAAVGTPYRLAVDAGLGTGCIYRMLQRPCLSYTVEDMLAALGAEIRVPGFTLKLERKRGTTVATITASE